MKKSIMKKIYTKPEAEYVNFYSKEEITNSDLGDETISGDMQTINFLDLGFDWT